MPDPHAAVIAIFYEMADKYRTDRVRLMGVDLQYDLMALSL